MVIHHIINVREVSNRVNNLASNKIIMTKEEFILDFGDRFADLSMDEMVSVHNEYCSSKGYSDDFILSTNEFDDYYDGCTPTEIALAVRFGDYNPNHEWFQFNGYANPVSSDYPSDFIDVDSIAEWVYENEIDLSEYGIDIDFYDDEDVDE